MKKLVVLANSLVCINYVSVYLQKDVLSLREAIMMIYPVEKGTFPEMGVIFSNRHPIQNFASIKCLNGCV